MELLNLDVLREYGGALLAGLALTVALTFVVIALALVLAIPVALLRMSQSLALRTLTGIYVEVIRGTPLLLQLVYIYYVLPSIGINLNPIVAAIVGLTLNYTAYMSEVYRGGILAVPRNQWEAAATIGMTRARAFRRIILPQALKIVTPALGNYFISLFKDTALASVVTVQELTFTGQIISARSYQYFTIYTATAVLYLAVGYPSSLFVRWLETRSRRGYRARMGA
jgi:His/Glu/Gln/Arg/opine family amino acid ABC transporter permease subunit